MNKPLFIHCHIFKNAGTSLIESFRHAFEENAIELEPSDPDDYLSEELIAEALQKNPELAFISSHRIRLPLPHFINYRKVIPIIFFRDPIDRLGSVYRFEQNETRYTVYSALAKTTSMPAFFETILDVGFDIIISNVHAEFCSINEAYSFNDAKSYLENNALIGLVEDYHFSMALIDRELKKFYPKKSLLVFKENVTRSNGNVLSNSLKTIDEIGIPLTRKIINKNSIDYQLYDFVCNYLLDTWRFEKNKKTYLNFCKKNNVENEYTDIRMVSAPSMRCLKNNDRKFKEKEDDKKYYPAWTRLRRSSVNEYKPIVEAINLEFFSGPKCPLVGPGQELYFDFKIRWPYVINYPAIGVTIKSHRNTIIFNFKKCFLKTDLNVNANECKIYRIRFMVPEIVSGLYKIDLQAGIGLGDQFKALTIVEAVTAFGVKSAISAGSDFVPIESTNFRMKFFHLN